jgi:Zn-finger protein
MVRGVLIFIFCPMIEPQNTSNSSIMRSKNAIKLWFLANCKSVVEKREKNYQKNDRHIDINVSEEQFFSTKVRNCFKFQTKLGTCF